MTFTVECEQDIGGRWPAEVPQLSGVPACGETLQKAIARVRALDLHVLADRIEHGKVPPDMMDIGFAAA